MKWDIDFISHDDFKCHVAKTVEHYGKKLVSYDTTKFNSNIIDPVKMIFDKAVYNEDWNTIISNEIFRQRDKTNSNEIGYFHQKLFQYVDNCHVPPNGKEGGWDVIYSIPGGYDVSNGDVVHKIFVEMKNKHNTMNSSSSSKTYMKMQNQLLKNDDCACFLVEAIAKRSQNIVWKAVVDGVRMSHKRIRRVSIDEFYSIVTGEDDAFYKICLVLPSIIEEVLGDSSFVINKPHDVVYEEMLEKAKQFDDVSPDMAMTLAMYMLGFSTYKGFSKNHMI